MLFTKILTTIVLAAGLASAAMIPAIPGLQLQPRSGCDTCTHVCVCCHRPLHNIIVISLFQLITYVLSAMRVVYGRARDSVHTTLDVPRAVCVTVRATKKCTLAEV